MNVETEYTDMEWKAWGFYTESEQGGTMELDTEAGCAWERNARIDVTPPARDKCENPTPAKKVKQAEPALTQPALGAGAGRRGDTNARWGYDDDETPP